MPAATPAFAQTALRPCRRRFRRRPPPTSSVARSMPIRHAAQRRLERRHRRGRRSREPSVRAGDQRSDQIVDSVNAQDIGKLPDANTVEALQRITGVQIQRRYGEGATDFDPARSRRSPSAACLTQVQHQLHRWPRGDLRVRWRSHARSGGAAQRRCCRASTCSRTRLASTIEGDVAECRQYPHAPAVRCAGPVGQRATLKGNYHDRADKFGGSGSALYGNRFQTGVGEMGILSTQVTQEPYRGTRC